MGIVAQFNIFQLGSMINTKSLLNLNVYNGERGKFLEWKWSFYVALRAMNSELYHKMKTVEDNLTADYRMARLTEESQRYAKEAFTILALLCKEEAQEYIMCAEDDNGLHAWQLLVKSKTPRSTTMLLNQLLEPRFTSTDPKMNLRKWNKEVKDYENKTGEKISDAEDVFPEGRSFLRGP